MRKSQDGALSHILGLWRRRASELCEQGARHFANYQMGRLRNCHPWGVAVKPYNKSAVYCRHLDICPWCYGRRLSELYVKVCRALQGEQALVLIRGANFFPADMGYDEMKMELGEAREVLLGLSRAYQGRSCAVAWNVVLDPPTSLQKRRRFCLRSRFLMTLPASQRHLLVPSGRGWRVSRANKPQEPDCQKFVTAFSAYPVGLLLGAPQDVLCFLAARDGLRLAEVSGAFRSRAGWEARTEALEAPPEPLPSDPHLAS